MACVTDAPSGRKAKSIAPSEAELRRRRHQSYNDRLIGLREAGHITGTSRSRQYELIRKGKYPQPVKVGKLTKFSFHECQQYVADLLAARNGGAQ